MRHAQFKAEVVKGTLRRIPGARRRRPDHAMQYHMNISTTTIYKGIYYALRYDST